MPSSIVSLVAIILAFPLAAIANVTVIYLNQPAEPNFDHLPFFYIEDEKAFGLDYMKKKRLYWDSCMVHFAMERIKRAFPTSFSTLAGDDESYDLQARRLVHHLENELDKELLNPKGLELISPANDTIIYLIALDNIIDSVLDVPKSAPKRLPEQLLPEGRFWNGIARALTEFDPVQVRYVGQRLRRLVQIVANGAEQDGNPIPAIQLLQNVILRLDSTSSTLTTTHFLYIKTCLLSRAYSEAAYILDMPLYSVVGDMNKMAAARTFNFLCSDHRDTAFLYLNPSTGLTGKFSSSMLLQYNLYAAMCYMALQRYGEAKFFLEAVITAPTSMNVLSKIMVEAYKKWLLLGIIMNGETPTPPKTLSGNNLRSMRALSKPYECVAEAFKSGNFIELQAEVEVGAAWWAEDVNEGLIQQVCEAFRKFMVVRLGRTFSAVSVSEVAKKTSPDPKNISETVAYMTGLIQSGQLKADLVTSATTANAVPVLRFVSDGSAKQQAAKQREAAEMAKKAKEMQDLFKHVADDDSKLEVTKEYLEFLKKLKKSKNSELDPAGDPPGMEIDEEIMGDL